VSEGEGWDPPVEDVDPPPAASGFEEHPQAVQGETTWWQPVQAPGPMVATMPWEEPPAPKRRRWRKVLLVSLVVLLLLGGSGAGAKAYVDHRHEVAEKARIAAEKRAADAYVKAVLPLADSFFDAVQPIQDAFDAFEKLRPGIYQARDDVILRGGAVPQLTAVKKRLLALPVPVTHQDASAAAEKALGAMITATKELQAFAKTSGKSTEGCAGCLAQEHFEAAMFDWQIALVKLRPRPPISHPGYDGGAPYGKRRPTIAAFIHASDLACAAADAKFDALPFRTIDQKARSLPKVADIIRATSDRLSKVPLPASRRALDRRLDTQLKAARSLADTMDKLYSAYRARSETRARAALSVWDEHLRAMDAVSRTYEAQGVSRCDAFFAVDEKDLKRSYRT
jgi:hypothetical protein